ncbi:MAG: hypothetical protein ACOCUR_02210, partial [Nanoarchaeota archaeon]
MRMNKKSQSAMEFLMTYGWAFLVCVLVVVALYTFGVLDFLSWLPSYCRFDGGQVDCNAYVLNADITKMSDEASDNGYVLLRLDNMLNEPIVVTGCRAYVDDGTRFCLGGDAETSYTTEGGRDDYINCSNTLWQENKVMNLKLTECEFASNSLSP